MIAQQTARFKDAINLLLDLSHIQAGNLKLTAVPLDLVALVRRVVADIRPLFAQHLIALQHSGTALMIDGDATRLQQALHNLLQHTIDHYPAGETIQVSLSQYKSLACLLIADQGRGPPDDVYPEMPAWSGHARSAEPLHPAGMSLGFSIAREIITLHGGSIDVTGQQGQEEGKESEGMHGRGHRYTR
jgi:signal transduction histidine kinase